MNTTMWTAQGIAASCADVDVAIEFSTPETAPANLQKLAEAKIQAVTGTTGWLEQLPAVRAAVNRAGTGLVWSPNFSVGVRSSAN